MANSIRRYEGRVVTVIGGGSGLGEGFANRFAREGASVAVLDLDATRGNAVAASLSSYGVAAMYSHVDVTDAQSVVGGVDAVVERFGKLDVAVNSAGIGGSPSV